MFDVYDFFNSPDVAEHCRSIGHKFNALESAIMVSQSNFKSLAEKHDTYRSIIAEYSDMEIPKGFHHGHIKSFHQALKNLIKHEEYAIEKYMTAESGAVYQATILCRNEISHDTELFTTYEKALADALNYIKEEIEYKSSEVFLYIRINKKYLDSENYICARTTLSGDITEIELSYNFIPTEPDEEQYFLNRYIYVPTPFKRGDLVEYDEFGSYVGDVYVLQNLCYENKYHDSSLKNGDLSDMTAYSYYMERMGAVSCESIHFYPDLKYCRRELTGEARILKYISLHLQDDFCLCSLLNIQKYILADKIKENAEASRLKYDLEIRGDTLLANDKNDEQTLYEKEKAGNNDSE